MSGVKLTGYSASIVGDYMKVYFGDFPLSAILSPPEGWSFRQITQWRKGCQDECWRVLYKRAVLSTKTEGGE